MLLKENQDSQLDVIKNNHNGDNEKCCKDMLWYWLSANTDASWKQLIDALRSGAVRLPVVADKIEKILLGLYVCPYVCTCIQYTYIIISIHTYMCTYIHTCIHMYVFTYMHMHI